MPSRSKFRATFLFLFAVCCVSTRSARAQQQPPCPKCATWNIPQQPFRIYGNTYYVGTHGLSAILITSDAGHVLLDAALPESAPQIVSNIRTLGLRIEDVKLIVNSHVHFDHGGGIAELQRLSGARVAASKWSAGVLKAGGVAPDDPQHGIIRGIDPVARVETLHDGEVLHVGPLELTAHLTPGHTPGGTTWIWKSCEAARCVNIVYADSLSAVSGDNFRFTDHPQLVQGFRDSLAFLRSASCDILLTTHPEVSDLWDRLAARQRNAPSGTASAEAHTPDPMIDPSACLKLATNASSQLEDRLASEKQNK